jgi:hypothetical protein
MIGLCKRRPGSARAVHRAPHEPLNWVGGGIDIVYIRRIHGGFPFGTFIVPNGGYGIDNAQSVTDAGMRMFT